MAIPAGLVPAALLLTAAVGLLALLPSLAQTVWEVPHLVLLSLVISYGIFTQRNAGAGGNGSAAKEGSLAWNARYHPDGPLVVVANHAAPSDDGQQGACERPISLPVRRLKTAPSSAKESETDGDVGDAFREETNSCASSSGL
ncbi:hypothetical protein C2845_PM09G16470 [Panicum miliaceum]|uniref:Uncharacterized protein n=1 Tax=Panicum miliaceum TaxID=4540 RepID=A0A3L6S1E6_PANMI|nr:hypothetical protein C2845_PM09G16470 [Panicum miliaceum]